MSPSPHHASPPWPLPDQRRRRLIGALAGLLAAWPGAHTLAGPQSPGGPAALVGQLRQLADRYVEATLDAEPLLAAWLGQDTPARAARLPIGIAPAHLRRMKALQSRTLAQLRALPARDLPDEARTLHEVLDYTLTDNLAGAEFPGHLLPLDHMGYAVPFSLAMAADNGLCSFATPPHYARHLARLRHLPAWCRQAEVNIREGVRRGIVWPRVLIERMLPMLAGLTVDDLARNPYAEPLRRLPESWSAAQRAGIRRGYEALIRRELLPVLSRLGRVVEQEWLPRGHAGAGLGDLPDGARWYAHAVRSATTTLLTPPELHQLGLAEVARLQGELRQLQARFGHSGSLPDFLAWHAARPETTPFRSEAEVLDAYRAIQQQVAPALPRLFGRLPRAELQIRAEPELTRDTASDHYNGPAEDGSRPGVFYAVIRDPRTKPVTEMATLFLHEGLPGHHLQTALAQESDLPALQRLFGNDAYVEGWAHYAETLGHEIGLYAEPTAHLGHVLDAMLRAVRLVVDTGLHQLGWTREQAIAYLREHTGDSEDDARAQIERYMAWPGQALAYAVGKRSIEQLRDEARAAQGPRFSLAAFHDQVLGAGNLPLAVLQARVRRWVDAGRRQPA
ncbi:MAG: hypothetical protein RLZZ584_2618 [Pseudomonadota bacterium]|jgi:uncharacterized protein (DUF885 family)